MFFRLIQWIFPFWFFQILFLLYLPDLFIVNQNDLKKRYAFSGHNRWFFILFEQRF